MRCKDFGLGSRKSTCPHLVFLLSVHYPPGKDTHIYTAKECWCCSVWSVRRASVITGTLELKSFSLRLAMYTQVNWCFKCSWVPTTTILNNCFTVIYSICLINRIGTRWQHSYPFSRFTNSRISGYVYSQNLAGNSKYWQYQTSY